MNTMMPAEQTGISLDDEKVILAMNARELEFMLNLIEQAGEEVEGHVISGLTPPFLPSEILKSYIKYALRVYNAGRYLQIRQIAEIFALPLS